MTPPRPLRQPQRPDRRLSVAFALLAAILTFWSSEAIAQVRLGPEVGGNTTFNVVSWRDLPFRTVVRQQYDFSCGSAALATLLHYHYGIEVTETDVFKEMYAKGDQAKIRQVGFSLLDMKRYLAERGFKADGFRMTFEAYLKTETPAIALIDENNYKHFVVIKGVSGGNVLIGDPALGLKTYPRADFLKMWNGIVFAIPRTADKSDFNREDEWASKSFRRLDTSELSRPIDQMTRELEPLYQISPVFSLDWALSQ